MIIRKIILSSNLKKYISLKYLRNLNIDFLSHLGNPTLSLIVSKVYKAIKSFNNLYFYFSSGSAQKSLKSFKVFFLNGPLRSTKNSMATYTVMGVGKGCLAPFFLAFSL